MEKDVYNLKVTRSNKLVRSSYSLSLNERRLIELSIATLGKDEAIPDELIITAKQFSDTYNISPKLVYRELKSATNNLYEQSVIVDNPMVKGHRRKFRWVDGVEYQDAEGYVKLSFTKWVKPYLQQLSREFTSYRLLEIGKLNSSHAIRLYELIQQYSSTGWREETLEELRKLFGVQDNYSEWFEFNRRVLKPAIDSINKNTQWNVKAEKKTKGRRITAIKFHFWVKDQQELDL